jgi:hypothetical protein
MEYIASIYQKDKDAARHLTENTVSLPRRPQYEASFSQKFQISSSKPPTTSDPHNWCV